MVSLSEPVILTESSGSVGIALADVGRAARAIVAAANVALADNAPAVALLAFKKSSGRADRDAMRRLIDRAATHIYPTILGGTTSVDVEENSKGRLVASVTVTPAESRTMAPLRWYTVDGEAVFDDSREWKRQSISADVAGGDLKVAKRRAKAARAALALMFETQTTVALQVLRGERAKASAASGSWVLESRGVHLSAAIVACDSVYGYIAVRTGKDAEDQSMTVVGKLPVTPDIASTFEKSKEKARPSWVSVADEGALNRILRDDSSSKGSASSQLRYAKSFSECHALSLVFHRARVGAASTEIWLDEAYAVGAPDEPMATVQDLTELLAEVCEAQIEACKAAPVVLRRLVRDMQHPGEVVFKKDRKAFKVQPVPKAESNGSGRVDADESSTIEFKAKVSGDSSSSKKSSSSVSTMSAERARNTLASFLNASGGVLMIGVKDDGSMTGVSGEAATAARGIRLGGFFPALPQGALVTRDIRAAARSSKGDDEAKPKLAASWWKGVDSDGMGTGTVASPLAKAGSSGEQDAVVVAILAACGCTAPFYTTGRGQLPYVRAFASSVAFPVELMVRRVAVHIPADIDQDGEQEIAANGDGEGKPTRQLGNRKRTLSTVVNQDSAAGKSAVLERLLGETAEAAMAAKARRRRENDSDSD